MRFPITEKAIDQIKEVMVKKPDQDFIIEARQSSGIIAGLDLVFTKWDDDLQRNVEVNIPLDIGY